MNLLARSQTLQIYRTVLTVAMMYLVVLTTTLSPLKQMLGFIGTDATGQSIICYSGDDHPDRDQNQHKHQSDCCVLCGRHDVTAPVLGVIVETLTVPTRIPSEILRFTFFQSRAPPILIVREALGQDPPLPA